MQWLHTIWRLSTFLLLKLSDLKQNQSFHRLLGLSDKEQMIKNQNKLAFKKHEQLIY